MRVFLKILPETDTHQNFDYLEDTFEFQIKSIEKGAKSRIYAGFAINSDPTPETPIFQTLGSNIQRIRLEKGLTRVELSKLSNVNLSNLADYEKDKIRNLDSFLIQRIAKALQVKETELFSNPPSDARDAIDVLCPPLTIGSKIRNLRLRKSMQQKDLAKLIGIDKVSLCRYEKDQSKPDKAIRRKLTDILEAEF